MTCSSDFLYTRKISSFKIFFLYCCLTGLIWKTYLQPLRFFCLGYLIYKLSTVFYNSFNELLISISSVFLFLKSIYLFGKFLIYILNWFFWIICIGFQLSLGSHWVSLKSALWILYLTFKDFILIRIHCLRVSVILWGCHITLFFIFSELYFYSHLDKLSFLLIFEFIFVWIGFLFPSGCDYSVCDIGSLALVLCTFSGKDSYAFLGYR